MNYEKVTTLLTVEISLPHIDLEVFNGESDIIIGEIVSFDHGIGMILALSFQIISAGL